MTIILSAHQKNVRYPEKSDTLSDTLSDVPRAQTDTLTDTLRSNLYMIFILFCFIPFHSVFSSQKLVSIFALFIQCVNYVKEIPMILLMPCFVHLLV